MRIGVWGLVVGGSAWRDGRGRQRARRLPRARKLLLLAERQRCQQLLGCSEAGLAEWVLGRGASGWSGSGSARGLACMRMAVSRPLTHAASPLRQRARPHITALSARRRAGPSRRGEAIMYRQGDGPVRGWGRGVPDWEGGVVAQGGGVVGLDRALPPRQASFTPVACWWGNPAPGSIGVGSCGEGTCLLDSRV